MALPVEIGLNAAIVTVRDGQPHILAAPPADETSSSDTALPFGPFNPLEHRTLETGLRAWVAEQTALPLGYVEQLYTFGDRGRHAISAEAEHHMVSVGYLALTRYSDETSTSALAHGAQWQPWYRYFPWEDWRNGRPKILDQVILPKLEEWSSQPPSTDQPPRALGRAQRLALAFGSDTIAFDEERVLERYELLYEAGLVDEAVRDGRPVAIDREDRPDLGHSMQHDHRRILATAMARLRSKLKYRPVVFELMPEAFTLTELQQIVESISGRVLHKQNFRRLVENTELVEPTGQTSTATGGRPAALFQFRSPVLAERPAPGLRV
ncbi:NUDIX hydrolase [Coralliovum pocilloporae]|uniref:NUDIX hydrolase n=1 Tax=Coralliovum pocilloporae TaxID=3066369 RepID=UPI0033079C02